MAEPYTLLPGYSGPFLYDPSLTSEPIIADVFGRNSIQIMRTPAVFPASLRLKPVPIRFTLDAKKTGWTRIKSNLAEGLYRWTYISGAVTEYDTPPILTWCQGFPGPYSGGNPLVGPTAKPWLRSNSNPVTSVWFLGFDTPGFPSAEIANAYLAGKAMLFNHPGGPLDVAYDADETVGPAQGSIIFDVVSVPLPAGDGYWSVVYSSLPNKSDWPTIAADQIKTEHPVIGNLKPGVHLVSFNLISYARTYSRQDYWIWVWKTQPRNGTSDSVAFSPVSRDKLRNTRFATLGGSKPLPWEIMPARPPQSAGNKVGRPLIERGKLMQPHPTTGNTTERPRTDGFLPKTPEQLGDGEAF